LESITILVLVILILYAIPSGYIYFWKIIPFWEKHKKKHPEKSLSLETARDQKYRVFLESYSGETNRPWV